VLPQAVLFRDADIPILACFLSRSSMLHSRVHSRACAEGQTLAIFYLGISWYWQDQYESVLHLALAEVQ
jgi:hypothetical protein